MFDIVFDLFEGVLEYFQERRKKKRLKKEAAEAEAASPKEDASSTKAKE